MADSIRVYTRLDDIFDSRRGILTHLAKENGNDKFDWSLFEPIYQRRKMDLFNQPELGITQEGYLERFKKRNIYDFVKDDIVYFYPSRLLDNIFVIIREIEFGVHQTIMTSPFHLTVNTYPYELNDYLYTEMKSHILGTFRFPIQLDLVSIEPEMITANFFSTYRYVFQYDFFTSDDIKEHFAPTYLNSKGKGTTFVVPSLYRYDCNLDELNGLEADFLIQQMGILQGGLVNFHPVDKSLFDYKS